MALAGKRVILIEADLRRPKIGGALGVRATRGIASVLIDGLPLGEALQTTDAYGENLRAAARATAPASGWRTSSRCRPPAAWSRRPRRWPTA